jgi:hypothetical protein
VSHPYADGKKKGSITVSGMVFEVGSVVDFKPVEGLIIQYDHGVKNGAPQWSGTMNVLGFATVVVERKDWVIKTELMPVFYNRAGDLCVGPMAGMEYRVGRA